jgi:hypothetical protein
MDEPEIDEPAIDELAMDELAIEGAAIEGAVAIAPHCCRTEATLAVIALEGPHKCATRDRRPLFSTPHRCYT